MSILERLAAVAVVTVMGVSAAHAQAGSTFAYDGAQNCVAEVGKLDANGDGYVDNTEYSRFGRVQSNVDTNGDGRISPEERTVACETDLMREAFVPEGNN